MDTTLIQAIQELPDHPSQNGFLVPRYLKFLGRVLKHGAMSPTWHLRLFREGAARCESRKYDQHFYLSQGTLGRLQGHLVDEIRMSLSEWTTRHNRWSDAEVDELTNQRSADRIIQARAFGNPIEQKRYWRTWYDQLPILVRPFALFLYRYFLRLGFLDGREGLIFWTLQTFWFRFLIDAKLIQLRNVPSPSQLAPGSPPRKEGAEGVRASSYDFGSRLMSPKRVKQ